jgi:hypothetical protein
LVSVFKITLQNWDCVVPRGDDRSLETQNISSHKYITKNIRFAKFLNSVRNKHTKTSIWLTRPFSSTFYSTEYGHLGQQMLTKKCVDLHLRQICTLLPAIMWNCPSVKWCVDPFIKCPCVFIVCTRIEITASF